MHEMEALAAFAGPLPEPGWTARRTSPLVPTPSVCRVRAPFVSRVDRAGPGFFGTMDGHCNVFPAL